MDVPQRSSVVVRPRDGDSLLWDEPCIRPALQTHDFAALFKLYRSRRKVSQTRLGMKVGLSQPEVSDIERGRRQVQSLDVVQRCVSGLGIPGHLLSLSAPVDLDPEPPQEDPVGSLPWNDLGSVLALQALDGSDSGGPVQRRRFAALSAVAVSMAAARWSVGSEPPTVEAAGGRRVPGSVATDLQIRLDRLRHMDDVLGSGDLVPAAAVERRLATKLLTQHTYDETTRRALHAAASEAARIGGWLAYDTGDHNTARRLYLTSLRNAVSAGDDLGFAHTLSYAAIQAYSTGRAGEAVQMLEAAQARTARTAPPRMRAMLHGRAARAHATAGERPAAIRALNAAFDALDQHGGEDEPPYLYWVTRAELLGIAGSTALTCGDPRQAITYFTDAMHAADYDTTGYPRAAAIYYTRIAEAHLALGTVDAACQAATTAIRCLGGVASARGTATLTTLRTRLTPHHHTPEARTLLAALTTNDTGPQAT